MAVIDIPQEVESVPQGAMQCRRALNRAIKSCQLACQRVAVLAERHTRAALAAELGDDAAELLTVYNALKAIANDNNHTVPDLPT
jgi:prephenate dehydratase